MIIKKIRRTSEPGKPPSIKIAPRNAPTKTQADSERIPEQASAIPTASLLANSIVFPFTLIASPENLSIPRQIQLHW
jgi:hypothetical protein